jgi:hypothetical protein
MSMHGLNLTQVADGALALQDKWTLQRLLRDEPRSGAAGLSAFIAAGRGRCRDWGFYSIAPPSINCVVPRSKYHLFSLSEAARAGVIVLSISNRRQPSSDSRTQSKGQRRGDSRWIVRGTALLCF